MIVVYHLRLAYENGFFGHPIDTMRSLGFVLISGLPETIMDAWIFEVQENNTPLPSWLEIRDEKDITSLPEWEIRIRFVV